MILHPALTILFVIPGHNEYLEPLLTYLAAMDHVRVSTVSTVPEDLSGCDVVVTMETAAQENRAALERYVSGGGGWLALVSAGESSLPLLFGVLPGPCGPYAEQRLVFQDRTHAVCQRLPDAFYASGRHLPLKINDDDVELVLYADWHYQHAPVLTIRRYGQGYTACTTVQAYTHPVFQQTLYRVMGHIAGRTASKNPLGVGLLGYAPSVGQIHGLGVLTTPGLALQGVCDINQARLEQAARDFPEVNRYQEAEELGDDPAIDVVIICTPPNNHALLSILMMERGKHVICEKPLALSVRETDQMAAAAERHRVHVSCHQNRRWDVDYRAIRQALNEGLLGELFYLETFVGGFKHPCGYWHSHAPISGGTAFDWGGHYIDWIVGLVPDRAVSVIGTSHKRVWHDVSNADQERIQIRFAGGQEAEFLHSDIAAVRKPKWYLLGTAGAIVGHWRDVTNYEIDPIVYYHEHTIPATEMTPDLMLYRRHHAGEVVPQRLPLPSREHFLFFRNIADHLLTGEPLEAPLADSMRGVALMEAAARSASQGGTVEVVNV